MSTTPASSSRPPVRLAFCITELEPGGAERVLVELVTRLDPSEFAPEVYSLGVRPTGELGVLVERLTASNIPTHFLNASSWQFPVAVARLRKLLKQQRPAILQGFLFHATVVGAFAGRLAGVPRVVTGIRVAERRRWHWRIARWVDRLVDRHVCVSRDVGTHARMVGLSAKKLLVIPNGVDLQRFQHIEPADLSSYGIAAGREAILFAGRLDRQKGIDWLLELAPDFLARLPGHDLLILGRGPLEESLKRRRGELGISDRVHFAGWQQDIRPILAASSLLVLPSRWEGMSNVLLEAMAAELPVVSSSADGSGEVLSEAVNGQIVVWDPASSPGLSTGREHPAIPQQFADRIVQIASNPEQQNELGRCNRRRIEADFTIEQMVRSYEKLYRELLTEARE